jgi:DNA repair exonuclease SbcCD nuclease subunit
VFHHKVPGRTSHSTVMRLINWASTAYAPVYAVPGNHDLSHDRIGSLHENQPLGVVFASGAIKMLDGWMDGEDLVYGVPWLMTFDDTNVMEALAEYRDYFMQASPTGPLPNALVVTHAPLYPPGQELKFEFYPAADWATAMNGHGTVHYGHVHEPHGIYQAGAVTFSNCGALSRGSLHEHNLARTPSVAIWNSDTGKIRHCELDAKPASEVFRLTEANQAKAEALNLKSFLDSVAATRLDVTSIEGVLDHVRRTQQDAALVAVIAKLLTEVDA